MNLLLVIATVGQAKTSSAADEFVRLDPYGVGMTFIAMFVVLIVLTVAYLVFKNTAKIYGMNFKKVPATNNASEVTVATESTGEEMAAISMALHLYKSAIHDHESAVLTINKMGKNYSPWSSKIYGINRVPVVNHIKR